MPAPGATTYDLMVAATDNRILDSAHSFKEHVVTMTYTYQIGGVTKQGTKECSYGVVNLGKIGLADSQLQRCQNMFGLSDIQEPI